MNGRPTTQLVWNDGFALAYQVFGDGPDLVYLPPWASSVDWNWLSPAYARFLRRLASFARTVVMDRRGWGCSDRLSPGQAPAMEDLIEDLVAVIDATNGTRPTLFASGESGLVALAAAAARPDLFSKLVLFHCSPVGTRTDDMPWEDTEENARATVRSIERAASWDDWYRVFIRDQLPSLAGDEAATAWVVGGGRSLIGPGAAANEARWFASLDERELLARIELPTLLLGRRETTAWPIESSRFMAERLPNARLVELDGRDTFPWVGDWESVADEIQEFVTGGRDRSEAPRSVATVLFTDVVGSTVRAADLGDAEWHVLLAHHDETLRALLRRHHGTEIGTTGDGLFATFETAAGAVRCATEMSAAVRELGLEIRVGIHTGEVEHEGHDLRGIAVHIGARVMSVAGPSEVLVSSTVKDLAEGSGLLFEDAGEHDLKGVPGRWHLFRTTP